MKYTASILAATLASAAAFTAPASKSTSTALKMADVPIEKSITLPFLNRPKALDGTYAGNVGFDPFGFAKNKEDLRLFREAEIKHARLAMLAAAGWPLSELFDKKIAAYLDLQPVVDASNHAPSVLNGGLAKISPVYWAGILLLASAVDIVQIQKSGPNSTPGDLGFDPFNLFPADKEGQYKMLLTEIKHGRLAMIAITAFAFQEAVSKIGIIDETPFFFHPLS